MEYQYTKNCLVEDCTFESVQLFQFMPYNGYCWRHLDMGKKANQTVERLIYDLRFKRSIWAKYSTLRSKK